MAKPILTVENLTVALPEVADRQYAVADISFTLEAGEILCIVGESGSGKSVTANAVMGLLPPILKIESGKIRLHDREIQSLSAKERESLNGRIVSMIFQDPLSALNPLMTIGQQIEEVMLTHAEAAPQNRWERVVELLGMVGLPDPSTLAHQYPFRLSGGQRQRVMIAMALALDPDLLIADEPTTALDVTTQAQILTIIRDLQRQKRMAVMFITHDFGVVSDIADKVIVMEKGKLIEQGTAESVLTAPKEPYTRRLLAAIPTMRTEARRPIREDAPIVLDIRNLKKSYKTGGGLFGKARVVPAVNDISFQLRKGETLGIVGESGSGKSTLGRMVMKLLDIDSGSILFDGEDVVPMPEATFRKKRPYIQMIFQDPFASLNPRHTIEHSLICGPMTFGVSLEAARTNARRLMKRVGMPEQTLERYPHEFSGGQRQRIGIARALMFNPLLLIADEAVSALDVSIQAQVLQLLDEIQQETKISMMFITHDLRVASQICDRIAVLQRGRLVELAPSYELFSAPKDPYTQSLVEAIPGWSTS
ncbi:ABC transporter ATP-binding protein [Brucella pseudintermedia]|uniref:ABC transporter ATP-binding protein n=1 Tax=Brucella pseudintermedia TaxID=370111 RepID=A0ABY5UEV9_9HYPH|nr:ABC transporter ATP-binding protein [Brucella pseudintermedia]UWL61884.1 ABC transporter ATP-binding protein [Brucella pseudintermedia]